MTEEELNVTCNSYNSLIFNTDEHLYQVLMNKESGDKAIYEIVHLTWFAYTPIYYELPEFQKLGIPFHFAFGERDWLNTSFNGENISTKMQEEGHSVDVISNTGHQLYCQNPDELIECLNKFLESLPED